MLFFIAFGHNSPVNFKLIHFLPWTKGSDESPNFGTSRCSGENLLNFSCHFPSRKSVFLQIFMTLYFFRSNVIYFARKGPMKVQIFETFECSDQNSPNSCHYWNKSVFLQFLHLSSVSWDITPQYFFSWNSIYFQQKEPIKAQIWWNLCRNLCWREHSEVWNFKLWWAPFVQFI